MTMNARRTILATLLAAMAVTPLAVAPVQAQQQLQAPRTYTQAELDQMLAPIALYPDALLSQVLMAATYLIEVVEAARWSRANPGLKGDDAVRAVQDEDWDPSVKSLVAFPEILQRMDEHLDWTRSLGDAFLAQENQLMDRVQLLRQRAETTGSLRSDEQIRVVREGPVIVVRPARPEYIYVPYYDPMEVYGTWWWPDYRPVYWAPWPGYARPRVSYGVWWGRPVGISLGFFFGDFDWNRRHVRVAYANSYYYRQPVYMHHAWLADRGRWQHDPHHRRGVNYRQAEVRQRFASAQLERREAAVNERRVERRIEMREDRREALREERRDERRLERRVDRQVAPAQAQTQAPAATERRADRREDRREDRQAARQQPTTTPPAPAAAQPREERRAERREERRENRRDDRQGAMEAQRQAQRQAQQQAQQAAQQQARQAEQAQRAAQQQARPSMPAAQAPQTPRAERKEERQERREQRREERGQKG